MTGLIIFGSLLIGMFMGLPVCFGLLAACLIYLIPSGIPLTIVPQTMIAGMNSFVLLAIPLFTMTGYLMDLPVVFAKKKSPKTIQNALSTTVHSFTKDRDYEVVISADFLTPGDNVLFVDDFLAYGNAALGILDLIEQSGAKLVGMGFIIEKAFQNGRKILEEKGVRVESLAIIEDLSNCCIKIKDQ